MQTLGSKRAKSVFSSALSKIKPKKQEALRNFEAAGRLIKKLEETVPKSVEIRLAGSLAKGTNLSGNNEFDIFLLFPRHYPHHDMSMLGLEYARKAFAGMRTEARYAEHPYLQVFSGNYHADIVPAYKIDEIKQKGSSVDRSQLHTEYVNSSIGAKEKDDVRLLKRFMKNFGIYGAELRIEGFSGYLCELLIIYYGSLFNLMKSAASWKEPALDLKGKMNKEKIREKFYSPLVVLDPVDEKRNVAAVVAQTSLSRFIFECRRFLKSPSMKFFFSQKRKSSVKEIARAMKQRESRCIAVEFAAPNVVPDVLWPQLKKTAQALVRNLEGLGFGVFGYYHWSNGKECIILFELERWLLPCVRKAVGPAIGFSSDVDAFVKKHKNSLNLHIEHDRIVAVEKREITDAKKAIANACKRQDGLGIPKAMQKELKKCEILEGKLIIREKYLKFLADYFFARIA